MWLETKLTVFCLTNTNESMIDMCRKFDRNNFACLKECYDQLCQMLRTNHAVLIKINVFCQEIIGYHLQFLEVISLYSGEARIRIERC